MKHPIQPIETDKNGTLRFKENKIASYLLDKGGIDMNALAMLEFSNEDREQFAQLIGYSLSGFGSLSYVSDETYNAAERMVNGIDESQARIDSLQNTLDRVRRGMVDVVPHLFKIHPDDLRDEL